MTPTSPSDSDTLSPDRRAAIEQAVKEAAWGHLQAPDAETALAYYAPDATVAGDGRLYDSYDAFARDARQFYSELDTVHVAEWADPRVHVLSDDAAVFTATVRWASTDTTGVRLDLHGVWTAVWVRSPDGWRIAVRHESFVPAGGEAKGIS